MIADWTKILTGIWLLELQQPQFIQPVTFYHPWRIYPVFESSCDSSRFHNMLSQILPVFVCLSSTGSQYLTDNSNCLQEMLKGIFFFFLEIKANFTCVSSFTSLSSSVYITLIFCRIYIYTPCRVAVI